MQGQLAGRRGMLSSQLLLTRRRREASSTFNRRRTGSITNSSTQRHGCDVRDARGNIRRQRNLARRPARPEGSLPRRHCAPDPRTSGRGCRDLLYRASPREYQVSSSYNIGRTKLEKLIHRVFDSARLDIEIKDRFGQPIVPREWFLVPLFVIDEAVEKIRNGTISNFRYDPKSASLLKA
jgi:hypothetical protein